MADEPAAPESPESAPAPHAEIAGSEGFQVGDHNVLINVLPGGRQPAGPVVAGEIPQAPVAGGDGFAAEVPDLVAEVAGLRGVPEGGGHEFVPDARQPRRSRRHPARPADTPARATGE